MHTTANPPNGRGCGVRDPGSAYLCCGVGEGGLPIRAFLFDPVRLWKEGWQRGWRLVKAANGVYHVAIFVGKHFYPRTWDFIVETSLFGASRKVAPTFPFHLLSPGKSTMLFLHARAFPKFRYMLADVAPLVDCKQVSQFDPPQKTATAGWHPDGTPCTFALQDLAYYISPITIVEPWTPESQEEAFEVNLPSFSYRGKVPIYPGCSEANKCPQEKDWGIASFMWLPLSHIEFYQQENVEVSNRAQEAGFEVHVLDW